MGGKMKKLNNLKLSMIIGLISIGSPVWASGGVAFGAVNAWSCGVSVKDLIEDATQEAKVDADKECQSAAIAVESEITTIKVLETYDGSCWAGTNSGSVVKIYYTCKYE